MRKDELKKILGTYSLQVGETIRLNHENCPAGEDTKRRLYITRPEGNPNQVLAYCHNCQKGNCIKTHHGEVPYRDVVAEDSNAAQVDNGDAFFTDPSWNRTDWDDVGAEARAWLAKRQIKSRKAYQDSGINYNISKHSIDIPVFDKMPAIDRSLAWSDDSPLRGIVRRPLVAYNGKVQNIQTDSCTRPFFTLFMPPPLEDPTEKLYLFIVEDFFSANWLASQALKDYHNIAVLCNYGVHVRPELFAQMHHSKIEKVIVWLDNDNDYVRDAADTFKQVCELVIQSPVTVHKAEVEPKHLAAGALKTVIGELIG